MKPFERFLAVARHGDLRVGQSAQIQIVSVQIFRTLSLGTLNLGLAQAWLDSADDAQRDLVLKCEDVTERPVISLSPDVSTARRFNKLASDTDAIAGFTQTAFEHVPDTKFSASLLYVDRAALKGKA